MGATEAQAREPASDSRDDGVAYRTLPHNDEAEQALLGAMLVNNEVANRVSAFLRPEHFFQPVHGRIYESVLSLVERGQIATPVTLKTYFDDDEALAGIGGAQYLARLAGSAVTIISAEDYGRAVHDLYLRRELINLGEEVVNTAFDFHVDAPARNQIEEAEQHLFSLAEKGEYEGGFAPLRDPLKGAVDTMTSAYHRDSGMTGVATGLIELDELLGGLHPADLIILAGRPSMGKTALATNIAYHAARNHRVEADDDGKARTVDGAVVGYFSLEMSAEQLAFRLLGEATGVSSSKLRRGRISDEEFDRVVGASQVLGRMPFFIDDTPALSVAALRTRARRLKRTHNLSLVMVDYLQLMRSSGRRNQDNRVLEIAEITQGLKALAKELDVPVLALSQLSRAVEQRDDKRPQLSDLRESGAIEQDADVVMFIYREEYYERRKEPKEGTDKHLDWQDKMKEIFNLAEVIVAKQRSGPIGRVDLAFDAATTTFTTLDRHHDPEDVPF